jgi:transposase-like protein
MTLTRASGDPLKRAVRASRRIAVLREERLAAITEAVAAGATMAEVARALGVTRQTVSQMLKRH